MKKLFVIASAFFTMVLSKPALSEDTVRCLSEGEKHISGSIHDAFRAIEEYKEANPNESYQSILNKRLSEFSGLELSKLFPSPEKVKVRDALSSSINMLSFNDYRSIYSKHLHEVKARGTGMFVHIAGVKVFADMGASMKAVSLSRKVINLDHVCFGGPSFEEMMEEIQEENSEPGTSFAL